MNDYDVDAAHRRLSEMALIFGDYEATTDAEMPETTIEPGQPYPFDSDATAVQFDNAILRRQVPYHDTMRSALASLAYGVIEDSAQAPLVVQLGCGNGRGLFDVLSTMTHEHGVPERFHPRFAEAMFLGVDTAEARVRLAKARQVQFESDLRACGYPVPYMEFREQDAAEVMDELMDEKVTVVLSTLVLQFMPMDHRVSVIQNAYRALRPGGALLLTEKLLPPSPQIDALYMRRYHEEKLRMGMTPEAIARKYASLPTYLQRLTYGGYREMLTAAGFKPSNIDIGMKSFHFAVIVARK